MGRGYGTRSHPLPLFLLVSPFVKLSLSDQSLVFGATSPVAPASSVSTKPGLFPLPISHLDSFLPFSLFLSFLSPLLPSLDPGLVSSFLLSFHTPNSGSFPSNLHVSATFSILLRFGEFWNPTNCEKFNVDGSLMGRTNLDKSVW